MAKKGRNVFIICTKGSINEVLGDFRKLTNHEPMVVDDLESIEAVKGVSGKIILMQYERLRSIDESWFSELFSNCVVLFDEIHRIKNPKSKLTDIWRKARMHFVWVYGVTGTAVTSNLNDLYWIANFLNPYILGRYDKFRNKYYVIRLKQVTRFRKVQEIVGYKNLADLQDELKDFMLSFFPERDVRFIESYGDISSIADYQRAAEGLWESEEEKSIIARLFDLQRLVDGDMNKLKVLAKEVKDRIDTGVIIFAGYYDAVVKIEFVLDRLKVPHKLISGKVPLKERLVAKEWFNESPKGKALIITNAGSQSINIQSTNQLIMFNIPAGLGFFVQCVGRIVRMNSVFNHFNIIMIGLRGTIDEYKIKYIQLSEEMLRKVFNNSIIPPLQESMHSYLKQEFKRNLLWRRKR
jgi:superfamily II DNA or RNA helicase